MDPLSAFASVQVKVLQGELKGRVFPFSRTECALLGRVREAAICLPDDPFVSRFHLLMETCLPAILLSDLGSRNGFFVNDRHFGGTETDPDPDIQPPTPAPSSTFVADGDVIAVGTNQFQIVVTPAPAANPPLRSKPGDGPGLGAEPASAAAKDLSPDSLVGPYRIVEEFGKSWMGGCYRAVDTRRGHPVTLKTVVPEGEFAEAGAEVFLQELDRVKSLDHPCLDRLTDCGRRGHGFFCVREEVPGMDLSRLLKLRGGKLDLTEAAPIMRDVLDGLAHAYANGGLVHRNLKPGNILVRGEGREARAVVADFGIFRALELSGLSQTIRSRLYFEAPCYWPRERITFSHRADPASEVFSAAAIFYQMLTGCMVREGLFELHSQSTWRDRPPGLADYLTLMAAKPLVSVREREPGLPAALAELLDRALSEPIIRRGAEDPGVFLGRARFRDPGRFRAALWDALPRALLTGAGA